jgi:hypothetical protein
MGLLDKAYRITRQYVYNQITDMSGTMPYPCQGLLEKANVIKLSD